MNPIEWMFWLIVIVLSAMAFRATIGMGWHWASALCLALAPLALAYFFGILGLLGSAMYVGGLYKASAR